MEMVNWLSGTQWKQSQVFKSLRRFVHISFVKDSPWLQTPQQTIIVFQQILLFHTEYSHFIQTLHELRFLDSNIVKTNFSLSSCDFNSHQILLPGL